MQNSFKLTRPSLTISWLLLPSLCLLVVPIAASKEAIASRQQKKPFCKVCFDAGKSEEEYTSHYLKDRPGPNGKVICPTLLTTECRYCHEHGHFKSHCPDLEKRKCDKERSAKARSVSRQQKFEAGNWMTAAVSKQLDEAVAANKLQRKQAIPQQSVAFASKSQFAVLDDSDDEEEIVYSRSWSKRCKSKSSSGCLGT